MFKLVFQKFSNISSFFLKDILSIEESIIDSSCVLLVHGSWQVFIYQHPLYYSWSKSKHSRSKSTVDSESLFQAKVKSPPQKNILAL